MLWTPRLQVNGCGLPALPQGWARIGDKALGEHPEKAAEPRGSCFLSRLTELSKHTELSQECHRPVTGHRIPGRDDAHRLCGAHDAACPAAAQRDVSPVNTCSAPGRKQCFDLEEGPSDSPRAGPRPALQEPLPGPRPDFQERNPTRPECQQQPKEELTS